MMAGRELWRKQRARAKSVIHLSTCHMPKLCQDLKLRQKSSVRVMSGKVQDLAFKMAQAKVRIWP